MSTKVVEFFEREAARYGRSSTGNAPFHTVSARTIEASLAGDVVSIGGLWPKAELSPERFRLTIVDASPKMLEKWKGVGVKHVVADARCLPFPERSFDHAVLPNLLHHIVERGARDARASVRSAFRACARVVRPGGRIWIVDFSIPRPLYWAEMALAPATRRVLALAEIPLVIIHTAEFFADSLSATGWSGVDVKRVQAENARSTDLITPIIGLPWLRIPRVAYPLAPVLISAFRCDSS